MLNLFKKKTFEPLNKELRQFFEYNLLWLEQEYPNPKIEERKVLIYNTENFGIDWNGTKQDAYEAMRIIATHMQINHEELELSFHSNGLQEINMGTSILYLETDPDNPMASGLYFPEKENGKFHLSVDENLLDNPQNLIATLAHELCHVKLLGEHKQKVDDEMLTDLATVFFGFGVFNANASFEFIKNNEVWGYNSLGYLTVDEWAYALAIFAFLRQEEEPIWSEYLCKTVKKEFHKCCAYLIAHEQELFDFD